MKRKKYLAHWLSILAVLTIACIFAPSRGEAANGYFVQAVNGYNNGAFTTGSGSSNVTLKAYFLDSMTDLSSLQVCFVVQGSGFSPTEGLLLAAVSSSFDDDNWEQAGALFVTLDVTGSFTPTPMNLKRKAGAPPFTTTETVTFTLEDLNFDDPHTADLTVNIQPAPVHLPMPNPTPVSLQVGTDYSGSNGLAVGVLDAGGVRYALTGMTLARDGVSIATNASGSDVWSSADAVTVKPDANNTGVVFNTPQTGAPGPKGPSTFTIGASALNVFSDNAAIVGGFTAGTTLLTFDVSVQLGGSIALNPAGTKSFKANQSASGRSVSIAPTPAGLNMASLKIAEADGSGEASSKTLNGLVLTADAASRSIVFSGTPTAVAAETTYQVVWYVDATNKLTADLKVEITESDVYRMTLGRTTVDGLTKGVALAAGFADVALTLQPDATLTGLLLLEGEGAGTNTPISWNGLTLTADAPNKKIAITGTPTAAGSRTFSVSAQATGGVVSPSYLVFTVTVHDSIAGGSVSTSPTRLLLPVQTDVSAKIDILPQPATLDLDLVKTTISDGTNTGNGALSWNGLEITAWRDIATGTCWMTVQGRMTQPLTQNFTLTFERGGDAISSAFTISGSAAEAGGAGIFTNPNGPVLFDVNGSPLTQSLPGNFVRAEYAIAPGSGIIIDAVSIRAPGATSDTPLQPFVDGTSQEDSSFLFDPLHNLLILRNTPSVRGTYTVTIYYEMGGKLYTQIATLKVGTDETPSSAAQILHLHFTVDGVEHTGVLQADGRTIVLELPSGADVSALSPSFTLSPGATVSPAGPYDFREGSIAVTVTAADGVTTKSYVLTVHLEPAIVESAIVDPLPGDAQAILTENEDGTWGVVLLLRFDDSFDATALSSLSATMDGLRGLRVSYLDEAGNEITPSARGASPYHLKVGGTAQSRDTLGNVVLRRLAARRHNDAILYVQSLDMRLSDVPGGVPGTGGSSSGCSAGFGTFVLLAPLALGYAVKRRQ